MKVDAIVGLYASGVDRETNTHDPCKRAICKEENLAQDMWNVGKEKRNKKIFFPKVRDIVEG